MARKTVGVIVLVAIVSIGGCGSSANTEAAAPGCPEGSTRRESVNEVDEPGVPSRQEAVKTELQNLGIEATEAAIDAGVVASSPGDSPGTEEVAIQTEEGFPVTMILAPLDPGWASERSRWCAPNPS